MKKYTKYELEKTWNYNLAEDEWILSGLRKFEAFSSDYIEECDKDGLVRAEIARGDKEWARRTAEKFNIYLPEKE